MIRCPRFRARMRGVALGLAVMLPVVPGRAMAAVASNSLTAAVQDARRDIENATQHLNALRRRAAEESLAREDALAALQAEVLELRQELAEARQTRDALQRERRRLRAELAGLREQAAFAESVLTEYRRSLETRLTAAEAVDAQAVLETADRLADDTLDVEELAPLAEALLGAASSTAGARVGGHRFEGAALDDSGHPHNGVFTVLGPAAYFAAHGDGPAGLAVSRIGSSLPSIYGRLSPDQVQAVRDLCRAQAAVVPVDLTAGDALRIAAARPSLWVHLRQGGFVMFPLGMVGLWALMLAIFKGLELARMRLRSGSVRELAVYAAGNRRDDADALVQRLAPPYRELLAAALAHAHLRREHLEEVLHEHVVGTLPALERHLGALAVLGAVAPLLGLLGTVTGMIHTFQLVTVFGTGEARLLSGGISEALVTTEVGLAVAIPVLLVHAFLARRVRLVVARMEDAAAAFAAALAEEQEGTEG